jgi:hypothetical protein
MIQMLYHCATTTCNLQKLFVPSLSASSRIRTCGLEIMRQVFYYCATASEILKKLFPELIFCENIFLINSIFSTGVDDSVTPGVYAMKPFFLSLTLRASKLECLSLANIFSLLH